MSCTLEELQAVEYEILCKFVDFCKKYDIKYTLAYGTLLGAVRHNGFIPWDDDVDVLMDIGEFNRFKKLIRKKSIEGFDFCWMDEKDYYYPFHFAKVRKQRTHMPEPALRSLDIPTGVWIDIFVYIDKPVKKAGVMLQEKILGMIQMIGQKYVNRAKGSGMELSSLLLRFTDKCPDKILYFLRLFLFYIVQFTGSRNSDYVRVYDYDDVCYFSVERRLLEPLAEHIFCDRNMSIPVNYDGLLKIMYGDDYMTPIKSHIHAHLEEIEL